jgi:hypothetical protein
MAINQFLWIYNSKQLITGIAKIYNGMPTAAIV